MGKEVIRRAAQEAVEIVGREVAEEASREGDCETVWDVAVWALREVAEGTVSGRADREIVR